MSAIASGQQFTYTASVNPTLTAGPDSIIPSVKAQLSSMGYQVLQQKVETPSLLSQIGSFAASLNFAGTPFNVTLVIQNPFDGNDTSAAQSDIDNAFLIVTGGSVNSSSITSVGPMPGQLFSTATSTGQPGQVDLGTGGLFGIPTWVLVIVAIIAILIVAVVLSPSTPARVAASFA